MRIIFVLAYFLLFLSCNTNNGYIYDYNTQQPLEGVIVKDVQKESRQLITNKDGKFSFSDCNDLIIMKAGFKTDTLNKFGCKPNGKCFNGKIFYMIKK